MIGTRKVAERWLAKGNLAMSIESIQRSLAIEIQSCEMESV
jgi:hypothetical protein